MPKSDEDIVPDLSILNGAPVDADPEHHSSDGGTTSHHSRASRHSDHSAQASSESSKVSRHSRSSHGGRADASGGDHQAGTDQADAPRPRRSVRYDTDSPVDEGPVDRANA